MKEAAFYKKWYTRRYRSSVKFSPSELWTLPIYPERQEVLKRIGPLGDKKILCLGNGASFKELYFSSAGTVVITDIVVEGLWQVKKQADGLNVLFCVADACRIPFKDGFFDVIYGWQMSHHLSNLEDFFKEIYRVLKPGGRAVFVDNGYSPLWHIFKWKIMRPLTHLFHKIRGVSERDLEFSQSGDYREAELSAFVKKYGFKCFNVGRYNFFSYIFCKFLRDVANVHISSRSSFIYPFVFLLSMLDRGLANISRGFRHNLRNMVWSFEK